MTVCFKCDDLMQISFCRICFQVFCQHSSCDCVGDIEEEIDIA